MDYIDQDMCSYMDSVAKKNVISEKHVLVLLYNMLCAVASLHQAGIMHRDVKPANMLVSDSYDVALIDFGLARICPTNKYYSLLRNKCFKNEVARPDEEQKELAGRFLKQKVKENRHPRDLSPFIGSRIYRSPEVILCERQYD